ncbi:MULTISPECIES: NUDIX hydrolase [unclassified Paenibacillus]|uniref:NUDIX hydrolase n=1 Tax=unclassified Paenibacillus TaxID=185978 RepID=UPI000AA42856|nr:MULTISPECIES: NUDIX hydrolase [unclassified Paenibacillus]
MGAVAIISQAVIFNPPHLLMVKQYVERGDIVWNFPGGGIEEGETPEEACVREVQEETGYVIQIVDLLHKQHGKYTFAAEIIGGAIKTEFIEKYNEDIIEVKWIDVGDLNYFDKITNPIRDLIVKKQN